MVNGLGSFGKGELDEKSSIPSALVRNTYCQGRKRHDVHVSFGLGYIRGWMKTVATADDLHQEAWI